MKNIKKLKLLNFYYNSQISYENIKNINMNHIILSERSNITINKLQKKIYMYCNTKIRDESLRKLNLISLKLHDNNIISNQGLKFSKNPKILDLCCDNTIINEGLVNMKKLEYLNLEVDIILKNNITDNGLRNLTKLKYLNLKK